MKSLKRHVAFIAICAVLFNGCSSWRAVGTVHPIEDDSHLRVTLRDSTVVEIKAAYARGDTLYGSGPTTTIGWRDKKTVWDVPVAIPMNDVEALEMHQTETGKTIAVIGGAVLLLGAGVIVLLYAASYPET